MGLKLSRRWTAIAFLASVLPVLVNHLVSHPVALVDLLAPSPIATIFFFYGAVKLLSVPPPDAKVAARFLAGIFAGATLVWCLRMVVIWSSIGGTNESGRADLTIADGDASASHPGTQHTTAVPPFSLRSMRSRPPWAASATTSYAAKLVPGNSMLAVGGEEFVVLLSP
jgi:hypothetical protein